MAAGKSARPNRLTAEKGDLVIWYGSEWTVDSVTDGVAVLRKHDDLDASGTLLRVPVRNLGQPYAKAADL